MSLTAKKIVCIKCSRTVIGAEEYDAKGHIMDSVGYMAFDEGPMCDNCADGEMMGTKIDRLIDCVAGLQVLIRHMIIKSVSRPK